MNGDLLQSSMKLRNPYRFTSMNAPDKERRSCAAPMLPWLVAGSPAPSGCHARAGWRDAVVIDPHSSYPPDLRAESSIPVRPGASSKGVPATNAALRHDFPDDT